MVSSLGKQPFPEEAHEPGSLSKSKNTFNSFIMS